MPSTDRARTPARLAGVATLLAVATTARDSWPMDRTTKACVDAYGSAQQFRKDGELLKARKALWTCAGARCPAVIQSDCTAWLNQVSDAIPSVVLEAKLDDDNVFDVSVTLDGVRIADQLDGKPVEIDPGLHSFVFERAGKSPIERKVIVAAHSKSQVVLAAWSSPPEPTTPHTNPPPLEAEPEMVRPIPPLAYVLGGSAVAALGTFAVLGISADTTKHDLESQCEPRCATAEVGSLQSRLIAADVAAGASALAATGAVVVFLVRPERPAHAPSSAASAVRIVPHSGGAAIEWAGSF